MLTAVIFDFFDVFRTDAYKSWLNSNDIPHEGAYLDASKEQDMGNIRVEQFLERLSTLQGRPVTRAELDASATVNHDVVTIAKRLRKNYKIALLSNAPSSVIREILAENDLEQHFDEIVISSEVGMVKPDAKIFTLTLEKLGVQAGQAIFIDDNPKNTRAAENVGIKSIQFTSALQLEKAPLDLGLQLS